MSVEKDVPQAIFDAIAALAHDLPADHIGFADVARRAGVHWTTVRRHIGSREALRTRLREQQEAQGVSHADTRSRILAAAEQVFADHGYAGTALDDVATAANLTKGALYWHFSSKSDLFLSLLEQNVLDHVRLLPEQLGAIADATNDRRQAVNVWLTDELHRLTADRRKTMLFFEFVSSTRDEAVETRMREVRRKAFSAALPLIRSLQERGLLSDEVNPLTLGLMVHALFDGLTLAWIVDDEEVDPPKVVRDLADLLLNGIGGPILRSR